jgi:hypothetical protein
MSNVTSPQGIGIQSVSSGKPSVPGSLAAAKERANVAGGPNPAGETASTNPLSSANFEFQALMG